MEWSASQQLRDTTARLPAISQDGSVEKTSCRWSRAPASMLARSTVALANSVPPVACSRARRKPCASDARSSDQRRAMKFMPRLLGLAADLDALHGEPDRRQPRRLETAPAFGRGRARATAAELAGHDQAAVVVAHVVELVGREAAQHGLDPPRCSGSRSSAQPAETRARRPRGTGARAAGRAAGRVQQLALGGGRQQHHRRGASPPPHSSAISATSPRRQGAGS